MRGQILCGHWSEKECSHDHQEEDLHQVNLEEELVNDEVDEEIVEDEVDVDLDEKNQCSDEASWQQDVTLWKKIPLEKLKSHPVQLRVRRVAHGRRKEQTLLPTVCLVALSKKRVFKKAQNKHTLDRSVSQSTVRQMYNAERQGHAMREHRGHRTEESDGQHTFSG